MRAAGHEVLLVRVAGTAGRPSTWWLPGGGLEFGETPEQCLTREFAEETGTSPQIIGLLDVVSDVSRLRNEPVELHSIRLIYEVEVRDRVLRAESSGSPEQAEWVPVSHIHIMHLVPWLRNWLSSRDFAPNAHELGEMDRP
ncbi:NUDIX domain-containing protein [Tessaracoccus sp. MC1756]|uniref:NUDIX domain-containing protein n=1 Tax=Tessaracoccus sp. MC1756 TaxID=2760311 RepID=UPI001602BA04|nr:NUDIX domain-containing protein [Tessaracoccus sp. MC1756]